MYVIILWEHCLCHPDSLNIHKLTNMLSSIWLRIITLGREGIPRNYADRVENVSLHSTPWTVASWKTKKHMPSKWSGIIIMVAAAASMPLITYLNYSTLTVLPYTHHNRHLVLIRCSLAKTWATCCTRPWDRFISPAVLWCLYILGYILRPNGGPAGALRRYPRNPLRPVNRWALPWLLNYSPKSCCSSPSSSWPRLISSLGRPASLLN